MTNIIVPYMSVPKKEICNCIKEIILLIKDKRDGDAITLLEKTRLQLLDAGTHINETTDPFKWVIKLLNQKNEAEAMKVMQVVINVANCKGLSPWHISR
jgi:hypothetical protein